MSDLDLNDATVLANLPGKDIYGVPVGHLVNAIEDAAARLASLSAELADWKERSRKDNLELGRVLGELAAVKTELVDLSHGWANQVELEMEMVNYHLSRCPAALAAEKSLAEEREKVRYWKDRAAMLVGKMTRWIKAELPAHDKSCVFPGESEPGVPLCYAKEYVIAGENFLAALQEKP